MEVTMPVGWILGKTWTHVSIQLVTTMIHCILYSVHTAFFVMTEQPSHVSS